MMPRGDATHRRRVLALLLATPTIVAAFAGVAIEALRIADPQAQILADTPSTSFVDALERQDLLGAYWFVRGTHGANGPIQVSHPVLTGGQELVVTPMVWAVALRDDKAVLMLLGHGERMDGPLDRRAACLADAAGFPDIARILRRYGGPAMREPCPARHGPTEPLLVWFLQQP
jgi:hypothetical protein